MINKQILGREISASFVVFLVALPLAMGIAVASGYPPVAGLLSGIVGGIVVGAISGAPLQVSGAAAGLSVLVFDGVQRFGPATMGLVILLAGLFQMAAALARLGRWFQAVSPAVIQGMLAGIGVLIIAGQMHVMMDLKPVGGGLANIAALPASFGAGSFIALAIGLLVIAVMAVWPKFARGRWPGLPAPLVSVALAASLAALVALPVAFVDIPTNLLTTYRPAWPDFGAMLTDTSILAAALQLALIASAESLLCAGAVDQMHDGPRTRYNRELAAQGLGNALCGLLGALPITGVIVRSSANVQAGAKTRLSAILHGVWLLMFIALLPHVLEMIPTAALAGLLVFTGVKLIDVKGVRALKQHGRGELLTFGITVATVVCVDLLLGVVAGLLIAGVRLLVKLTRLQVSTHPAEGGDDVVLNLSGVATFLKLPKLSSALETVPPKARVILQSSELTWADHACVAHIEAWRRRHVGRGGQVEGMLIKQTN